MRGLLYGRMETKLHPVARAGAVIGEHSWDEITEGLASGRFLGTDHVWAEGQARWVTLDELSRGSAAGGDGRPSGILAGVGRFLGAGLGALGMVLKFLFVISIGLLIGMILQSGGKNPNRQGDNDPLRDPYAGRRDPDFDDPDRES